MDRKELYSEFEKQISELGFRSATSMEQEVNIYLLNGGNLLGRKNHRTEVRVDWYGWNIKYSPREHSRYSKSIRWGDDLGYTAKDGIEDFLREYGL